MVKLLPYQSMLDGVTSTNVKVHPYFLTPMMSWRKPHQVHSGGNNKLLAKHKHTDIPTMMEPFPPPAPWF